VSTNIIDIDADRAVRDASVTQSSRVETKIDQLGTLRGKVGITNIFFGPNVMLYGTGGLAWAHTETTLTSEQPVTGTRPVVAVVNGAPTLVSRAFSDTFTTSAESKGYMFGWALGAGVDWKITPNLILGALYLHYDFPKDTLAFTESGVRMGNSRQEVDVIKGRLSWLFPIQ
jgi:outer membrane immunogenic protein